MPLLKVNVLKKGVIVWQQKRKSWPKTGKATAKPAVKKVAKAAPKKAVASKPVKKAAPKKAASKSLLPKKVVAVKPVKKAAKACCQKSRYQ